VVVPDDAPPECRAGITCGDPLTGLLSATQVKGAAGAPRRRFDRLSNRLTKIVSETRKIDSPSK
jgi:hypothetical protein